MGWTSFKFNGTRKEFLMEEFNKEPEWGSIIDYSIKGSVIYAALKLGSKHGKQEGLVTCLIILTSTNKKDYYNFSYKSMTESVGPVEASCPKRILDKLSPLNELFEDGSNSLEWATNWREKCYTPKPKPIKIEVGDTIKLNKAVKTTNGGLYQFFKYLGKNKWMALLDETESAYNIIRFRASRFTFEILKKDLVV